MSGECSTGIVTIMTKVQTGWTRGGAHGNAVLVEALCYKPEGPNVTGFFSRPDPLSHSMVLGSNQPLTEMSTWNFLAG
jgi:hypothetical protein